MRDVKALLEKLLNERKEVEENPERGPTSYDPAILNQQGSSIHIAENSTLEPTDAPYIPSSLRR